MNLVLLKLVEYLGHTNALLSGLAFDEVSIRVIQLGYTILKDRRFR